MGDRIPPPAHLQQYSQSPVHSAPHHLHLNSMRYSASSDRERYVAELLAERQKLAPFVQVLPYCTRLLNQEILRASSLPPNHNFVDAERIEHGSPLRLPGHPVNGQPMDLLKPMDESMDYYKKQQLRELAILNGTLREESPSPHLSPSISPFNSAGMKRPKTGR
ncbi:unnamed protein product [Triticum turgidum subsp. durum]|uniref:STAR protein homodimerisation region domain-containing protein n=1 Tax=Triticum turgidum subsp. durum TaxID=4567 RepID=A0A9R0RZ33_TRITD|nr:unnamed protein product [Triticum turgidum subsp. durum]